MYLAYMQEPLFVSVLYLLTSRQIGIIATDLRSSTERAPMLLKVLCASVMQNHTVTTAGTDTHNACRSICVRDQYRKQEVKRSYQIITVTILRKRSIAVYNNEVIILFSFSLFFTLLIGKFITNLTIPKKKGRDVDISAGRSLSTELPVTTALYSYARAASCCQNGLIGRCLYKHQNKWAPKPCCQEFTLSVNKHFIPLFLRDFKY